MILPSALRQKASMIHAHKDAIDCCGTGGDATGTYNISTATALVSAACGVPIAKHGNRGVSSASGAADVLEALGVNLAMSKERQESALKYFGFCFLMAPHHHQVMKNVAELRKALGFRTIFNLLGPLANPAGTMRQLLGVYDRKWVLPMAETLKNLGSEKAWVVHGAGGLDEISTTGETFVAILEEGRVLKKTLTPDDFGLPTAKIEDLKGGDAQENATALDRLLRGEKTAYRDIVLANTAAVLSLHDSVGNLKDGVEKAAEAIDDGRALTVLERYRDFSNEADAT